MAKVLAEFIGIMYSYKIRISYSMVDAKGKIKLSSMFSLFQDCGLFQSTDGGASFFYMEESDIGWVVAQYNLKISRLPKLDEIVTVTTIPYTLRGYFGLRAFRITDDKDEQLVICDSLWMLMQKSTGKPVEITDTIKKAYSLDVKPDVKFRPSKLRPLADDQLKNEGQISGNQLKNMGQIEVSALFIDSNSHMNNTYYIAAAESVLPKDFTYSDMIINYKKSARLGDVLKLEAGMKDDAYQVVMMKDDEVYAIVEFS